MTERSAAVIWDELEHAGCSREVILWNAFPWQPYGPSNTSSNRKPRLAEVADGRDAFAALLSCFTHPLQVFAVGKVAEDALRRWQLAGCAGYIRHPSHGGEALFRAGFKSSIAVQFGP
jgi:uracil-DNA glycosylase